MNEYRFDLHVHTEHSKDARGSILEIAERAAAAGLSGFCVTDHDTVDGHADIPAAMEATGLLIIPGIEVTTSVGHILAIGVHEPIEKGLGIGRTAAEIHRQGGIAVAAHPLRFLTGIGPTTLADAVAQGLIHAAESVNARERPIVHKNTDSLLRRLKLTATGGSDTHWMKEIGNGYTVFPKMPKNVPDAVKMIREGRVSAGGDSTRRRSVIGHQLSLSVPPLRRRVLAKLEARRQN